MGAERRLRILGALALAMLLAGSASVRAQENGPGVEPVAEQTGGPDAPVKLDLQMRLKDVKVRHTLHGDTLYVPTDEGTVELSPEQFSYSLAVTQNELESAGYLYRFFNITKPWSFAWIAVGFLGQALFTFRMVLQWWVSEKEKRSVIPVAFWWGSLFGGMLLLVYFAWRKDIVGIIGQSTGVFVYARNLVLIHRRVPHATA